MSKGKVAVGLVFAAAVGVVVLARRNSDRNDDRNPHISADPSEGTGNANITDDVRR